MRRPLAAAVLALLLLALALALVLTVNTLRLGSRQIAVTPLADLPVDVDAAARRLGAAVRARTISYDDRRADSAPAFLELQALLAIDFPNAHRVLQRELVNGASLLYTWRGTDPSLAPAMLLAHQDVVPIAPGTEHSWQQEPFGGVIADGFVWGRGAWDDKGNLMAMLEAVELLTAQGVAPRRTLYLGFGHDEEIGGQQGAHAIAQLLRSRGVHLDFVLDEGLLVTEGILPGIDAPVALIGTAEKGYLTMDVSVESEPGHSSMPLARTAIGTLSQALVHLEQAQMAPQVRGATREMFETLAPEFGGIKRVLFSNLWLFEPLVRHELDAQSAGRAMLRTTTALTTVRAGDKDNVLPGKAEAKVNFRLLPGDTSAQVLTRSQEAIADADVHLAASAQAWDPSAISSVDAAPYRQIAQAIREVFSGAIVAPGLMIAATDSRHYQDIASQVYRFTPVRAKAQDLSRFHGTDERVSLANYDQMIRFYRRLIELSTMPAPR
jgi:carboxypeptidase PM20D1